MKKMEFAEFRPSNRDQIEPWFWPTNGGYYDGRRTAIVRYDSLSEFVETASIDLADPARQGRRASREESDRKSYWTSTQSFAHARNLALFGWKSGTEKMVRLAAEMTGKISVRRISIDLALEGASVDIPSYLSGERECLWSTSWEDQRPAARIAISGGAAADVAPEKMIERGALILSLIDSLESAGISTEVVWIHNSTVEPYRSSPQTISSRVMLKRAEDPLDVEALAFACANPSMLRRIGFGASETMPLRVVREFGYEKQNLKMYGFTEHAKPDDLEPGDAWIGGYEMVGYGSDRIAWLKDAIQQMGAEIDE